jgi:parvulin-like peptidyl-prolyl isomerase
MSRLPWTFFILLALTGYVAADLYWLHGPLSERLAALSSATAAASPTVDPEVAARVHSTTISRTAMQRRLREMLYAQGVDWEQLSTHQKNALRHEAVDQLIHQSLITQASSNFQTQLTPEVELTHFQQDLIASGQATERLQMQHTSLEALREQILTHQTDSAWIEQQILPQLTAVTEADAKAWFTLHAAELATPESWQVAHIFLTGHQKPPEKTIRDRSADMQVLKQRLDQGEPWAQLCAESEDERSKRTAGSLGWVTAERMPADFISHVKKLRPGQTSPVIQTHLGWHIIRSRPRLTAAAPTAQ